MGGKEWRGWQEKMQEWMGCIVMVRDEEGWERVGLGGKEWSVVEKGRKGWKGGEVCDINLLPQTAVYNIRIFKICML